MAYRGSTSINNLVLYEVYVRNHSQEGTFSAVGKDLDRIASLGVDIIWFMPIHPIGKVHRKGSLGCPYAISDYRSVNPEYGTMEDFTRLIQAIHHRGMQVMMDVVFHHTSPDSILAKDHPEYFRQDHQRKPVTTVPDWSDVIALNHPNRNLTRYLADSLAQWARLGVDGFRCDVASLLPISIWYEIQQIVNKVNAEVIWLAESVHAGFVENRRTKGYPALSDGELYQVFDLTYDYDIWPLFQAVVTGREPVDRLIEMHRFQHAIYPEGYAKLHFVENHDQARIAHLAPSSNQAMAWTAFQAFNKGAFLIYGGQESAARHTPSLFERDPVGWNDYPMQDFISRISRIKKHEHVSKGQFILSAGTPAIVASYVSDYGGLLGVFNVSANQGDMTLPLKDGVYADILNHANVRIQQGKTALPPIAMILEVPRGFHPPVIFSNLMDLDIKPG